MELRRRWIAVRVALATAAAMAAMAAACKKPAGQQAPEAAVPTPTPPAIVDAGAGSAPTEGPDLGPPAPALVAVPDALAQQVSLERQPWADLERPVLLTFAPGDAAKRLFIVEQPGRIRVVAQGTLREAPFLDIEGKVSKGNEQGLLGLAFHPRFAENRRLYVNYTDTGDDTRVVEYTVDAADPNQVDPASAREVLHVAQPYSNHNGGHLLFGPDGKLYIGLGDGGSAGDPKGNGQDDDALLGKMLRLDVDDAAAKPQIVAKGLRNPWRYDFDQETGAMYIGDVGQDKWESVYAVSAQTLEGANFGWNVAEGRHCFRKASCDTSGFVQPVADFPHPEGCSVTGGVVYHGKAIPELDGAFFYADYCTALIRSFQWRNDGIRQHWDWKQALDPEGAVSQIASFGVDADGEVYVVSLVGDIFRLARKATSMTPTPTQSQPACETLTRTECIASSACTLHWIADSTYECRADVGPCEVGIGQNDRAACLKVSGCTWDPGRCYCPFPGYGETAVPDKRDPNGAGACACGGGQPSMCLPAR